MMCIDSNMGQLALNMFLSRVKVRLIEQAGLCFMLSSTNLYEVDTPLVGSCSKAAHIANDSSTKSNEGTVTVKPAL